MAGVDYVMAPDSFSLYHRPDGGEVGIFGDNHMVLNGRTTRAIPVSRYILRRLEANPDLHVYAEMPTGASSYAESENKQLSALHGMKQTYGNSGIYARLHNIDQRFNPTIISDELHEDESPESFGRVADIVRRYVRRKAPEILPVFDKELQDAEDELPSDDDPDTIQHAKKLATNPMVEANAVNVIKNNPHNARDMLFYVGSGHKNGMETYLDNPAFRHTLLYKRNASLTEPLAISRTDSI